MLKNWWSGKMINESVVFHQENFLTGMNAEFHYADRGREKKTCKLIHTTFYNKSTLKNERGKWKLSDLPQPFTHFSDLVFLSSANCCARTALLKLFSFMTPFYHRDFFATPDIKFKIPIDDVFFVKNIQMKRSSYRICFKYTKINERNPRLSLFFVILKVFILPRVAELFIHKEKEFSV